MMQGRSNRARKSPLSNSFPSHTPKPRDKDTGHATNSKMGKFGSMDFILNDFPLSVPSTEMGLSQDDDMVPWLNYPIEESLQHDYCSDFLQELSGVTANELSTHSKFSSGEKRSINNQTIKDSNTISAHNGTSLEQGNVDSSCGLQKDMDYHSEPVVVPARVDLKPVAAKPVEEPLLAEQSPVICEEGYRNDQSSNQVLGARTVKGIPDGEKTIEAVVACSSVCSGNSVERASNDPKHNLKRKGRDTEESECPSEVSESVQFTLFSLFLDFPLFSLFFHVTYRSIICRMLKKNQWV